MHPQGMTFAPALPHPTLQMEWKEQAVSPLAQIGQSVLSRHRM